MSRNDSDNISLSVRESEPVETESRESNSGDIEQDVTALNRNDDGNQNQTRQVESKRKRASVLAGSAIVQLPIWGFAINYGVFQEYYTSNWTFTGSRSATGIIGTTSNGVMYLAMPFLFALFTKRWARYRQQAAICGVAITCLSFLLSSFSTAVWHLVATQGVLSALGCALIYSPTTLSLGEWFTNSNRAVAYGVALSCKNIVGSVCPFLLRALLTQYGFRTTLRIWTAVTAGTALLAVLLIPTHPGALASNDPNREDGAEARRRKIPWHFLKHQTFYIYAGAIVAQSSGYGIPQTYLPTYAHEVTMLSQASATLLLTLFNIPGIMSSSFFGYLSDNKIMPLAASTTTAVSALSSALSAFLFWGLTSPASPHIQTSSSSMTLLILFSLTYGFFAGGFSATWGGVINELEREAAGNNEAVDTGLLYGLLNGARGVGYVTGGLAGLPLLKIGEATLAAGKGSLGKFAYGSSYGPLILFTGLSSVCGGWGLLWRCKGSFSFPPSSSSSVSWLRRVRFWR